MMNGRRRIRWMMFQIQMKGPAEGTEGGNSVVRSHFTLLVYISRVSSSAQLRFCVSSGGRGRPRGPPSKPNAQQSGSRVRSELKSRDQILKQRKRKAKQEFMQSGGMKKLRTKGRRRVQEVMKSGFGRSGSKKGKMKKRL